MKTKINSFMSACKLTGDNPKDLSLFSKLPDGEYHSANHQLLIIAKALKIEYSKNNKLPKIWEPDYNDKNQCKYETRFWIKADKNRHGGFGFSYSAYVRWNTDTDVGSRFAFPTSEIAIYFGEQFEDLHLKTKLNLK